MKTNLRRKKDHVEEVLDDIIKKNPELSSKEVSDRLLVALKEEPFFKKMSSIESIRNHDHLDEESLLKKVYPFLFRKTCLSVREMLLLAILVILVLVIII